MGLIDKGKMPKPLSWLLNFGRARSLWVYQWGLACCAIEMGAAFGSPRYDVMRLGVIPTIAPFMLPRLLNELRREHPSFQLFIREDLSGHLVDALHHGELDLLLLALPFPAEGVDTLPLFDDEFLLASPHGHHLATNKQIKTSQLKGESLLLLEDGRQYDVVSLGQVFQRRLHLADRGVDRGKPCRR